MGTRELVVPARSDLSVAVGVAAVRETLGWLDGFFGPRRDGIGRDAAWTGSGRGVRRLGCGRILVVPQISRASTAVAYEVFGDGPVIVLTHSFLFDRRMWRHQIPVLTDRGWRVIAIDMRGHGESGLSREPFTIYDVMDDTLAVLDAEDVHDAVWIGESIGGFLSLRAALRHPERVRALVIVDSDAGPEGTAERLRHRAMAMVGLRLGWRAIMPSIMRDMFGSTTRRERPDLVDEWSSNIQQLDRPSSARGIKAIANRDDLLPRLGDISAPTLVVVGAEDKPLPPERARRISTGIPDAELEIIEGAGHLSPLEQPERFNTALLTFLDRL